VTLPASLPSSSQVVSDGVEEVVSRKGVLSESLFSLASSFLAETG
jgi:hypothetical protein